MTTSEHPTDPSPPPSEIDTPPGGRARQSGPPRVVLSPEAQSDLLVRLVCGVEELIREVRASHADVSLVLEEGRSHAARLTTLESRVAALEARSGQRPDAAE